MTYIFGKTSSGYDVEINRLVNSDLTIYVTRYPRDLMVGGSPFAWDFQHGGLFAGTILRNYDHVACQKSLHDILNEMGALVESKLGSEKYLKLKLCWRILSKLLMYELVL